MLLFLRDNKYVNRDIFYYISYEKQVVKNIKKQQQNYFI